LPSLPAGQGIGAALCEHFAQEGAKAVVVADLNLAGAEAVATKIGGAAMHCDVSREDDIVRLIDDTEARFGPIDLFCSNAGIAVLDPDWDNPASAVNDGWMRSWAVNVMAHVYAARHLAPRMSARGGGYFLNTVSAAGLLSQIGGGLMRRPSTPRSASPRIWRSPPATAASRSRYCARKASTPRCCAASAAACRTWTAC
jgi:NAD(P)-dependent dehydrogenase (short-subunit alcohol dehydrogenase family)